MLNCALIALHSRITHTLWMTHRLHVLSLAKIIGKLLTLSPMISWFRNSRIFLRIVAQFLFRQPQTKNASQEFSKFPGDPHRSLLGRYLFALYIHDIKLLSSDKLAIQFADDLSQVTFHQGENILRRKWWMSFPSWTFGQAVTILEWTRLKSFYQWKNVFIQLFTSHFRFKTVWSYVAWSLFFSRFILANPFSFDWDTILCNKRMRYPSCSYFVLCSSLWRFPLALSSSKIVFAELAE